MSAKLKEHDARRCWMTSMIIHCLKGCSGAAVRGMAVSVWVLAGAASSAASTMFRGDAAHSAIYAGDGLRAFKGVKWSFKTGRPVVSSPVIADGVVFVGSDDKALHALDQATGVEKWKFATEGLVRSTPAVADGTVYFGSYDGKFYAVEAGSGKLRWAFETEGERKFSAPGLHGSKPAKQVVPDAWDCFLSSPVVAGGRVYFGSGDNHVYALDAASGALVWKFATGNVVHASPALADGVLYIGSWDTFFYALDAATGEVRWKFKTGEDPKMHNQEGIQASATVVDGVVYFGCRDFHLYALDAETGAEKWRHKKTWINATPVVHNGRVYGCTSIPAMFFALDAKTGEEIYNIDVKIPAFSSPVIAAGQAYFGSFSGKLYAVDLAAQKVAWEFQTDASKANARGSLTAEGAFNAPVIFRGDFFEQMFVIVDHLFELGAILSSPVVDGGVVYVGSADGNVYALE